jgi:hypothetical protein
VSHIHGTQNNFTRLSDFCSFASSLSTLSSILTLSWFVVAHVLEATSISTCRHTSPHIWWLVFGLLCIVYLMIFRVVIVAIFVLIITPAVFVSAPRISVFFFFADKLRSFSGIFYYFAGVATRRRLPPSNTTLRNYPKRSLIRSLW